MEREGVVKFRSEHRARALEAARYGELACRLASWREILRLAGLVGRDRSRYDGVAFGNVSARVPPFGVGRGRRRFLVSGTGTGDRHCFALADLSLVVAYDLAGNRVESEGMVAPSSEALTHAAVYDCGPHLRAVFHLHSPVLWRRARALGLPVTDSRVAYGTIGMAHEVHRLWAGILVERRIFAMGGHEDGLVVFGRSAEEAGSVAVRWLAAAYELECGREGSVCGPPRS